MTRPGPTAARHGVADRESMRHRIFVRRTQPADFPQIEAISKRVYPSHRPWTAVELWSHHRIFAEGQLVAVDGVAERVVGTAMSLIVSWEDYNMSDPYCRLTDGEMFTNHDPFGRTLYGAEVFTDVDYRGMGVGSALYAARFELCRGLGLRRIRAGARLPGYEAYAARMSPREYVDRVIAGELNDPTLSFQLRHDFRVIGVTHEYIEEDRESRGAAALIEWMNPDAS